MKSKIKIFSIILPVVLVFITALPGYCSAGIPIKQTVIKFLLAMGGVALSSFIIFAGLSIYNKMFHSKPFLKEETKTYSQNPQTVDDAINFFIRKNKLS